MEPVRTNKHLIIIACVSFRRRRWGSGACFPRILMQCPEKNGEGGRGEGNASLLWRASPAFHPPLNEIL